MGHLLDVVREFGEEVVRELLRLGLPQLAGGFFCAPGGLHLRLALLSLRLSEPESGRSVRSD